MLNSAPCKGNSLIIRLLPLQGVGLVWRIFTQGVALGYVVLPLRGVTLASFDTPSYVLLPIRGVLLVSFDTPASYDA
mgnify:CR=1 FL=1